MRPRSCPASNDQRFLSFGPTVGRRDARPGRRVLRGQLCPGRPCYQGRGHGHTEHQCLTPPWPSRSKKVVRPGVGPNDCQPRRTWSNFLCVRHAERRPVGCCIRAIEKASWNAQDQSRFVRLRSVPPRQAQLTDPAKRERAALDVLDLLPDRWAVGRGKYPETITGTGEDELAAMTDLAELLMSRG
jgi:hypothetical protein